MLLPSIIIIMYYVYQWKDQCLYLINIFIFYIKNKMIKNLYAIHSFVKFREDFPMLKIHVVP